ncbi:unnamed protein product [Haemonchus placei]|uniref:Uncharacterized protein n=1 Tax=Haemonchus placei TaxID=6290 RepID=A0A3P7WNR5_HAEPC|nr:unnamed protein product [Haemonchus placei]
MLFATLPAGVNPCWIISKPCDAGGGGGGGVDGEVEDVASFPACFSKSRALSPTKLESLFNDSKSIASTSIVSPLLSSSFLLSRFFVSSRLPSSSVSSHGRDFFFFSVDIFSITFFLIRSLSTADNDGFIINRATTSLTSRGLLLSWMNNSKSGSVSISSTVGTFGGSLLASLHIVKKLDGSRLSASVTGA